MTIELVDAGLNPTYHALAKLGVRADQEPAEQVDGNSSIARSKDDPSRVTANPECRDLGRNSEVREAWGYYSGSVLNVVIMEFETKF